MSTTNTESIAGQPPGMRFMQHKREAWWFYRFLSLVYDRFVNPSHWTPAMRQQALVHANLHSPQLSVVDVGGGTGFCTEGILQAGVDPSQVVLLDQSPHQMLKAKKKPTLDGVRFLEGDAEQLPFEDATLDRYVSAGSIEYWPNPQRAICEANRILKPQGIAVIIGPERGTNWFSNLMADTWMLFPSEKNYRHWFKEAGFEDVSIHRICPERFRGIRSHGLIMGIVVRGVKGPNASQFSSPRSQSESTKDESTNFFRTLLRCGMGCVGGGYFFILGAVLPLFAAITRRQS